MSMGPACLSKMRPRKRLCSVSSTHTLWSGSPTCSLEQWAGIGRVLAVPLTTGPEPLQWSAPGNFEQVQRANLSLLRQEVVTCPPQQFADFLLRWQYLHPSTRRENREGFAELLNRLEGCALPGELWEPIVLPARLPTYQPTWLDDSLASGEWLWSGRSEGEGDAGATASIALWQREHLAQLPSPSANDSLDPASGQVLECLRTRGALFVPDLASLTGLAPSAVRSALWDLVRRGWATNDRYEPVRRGQEPEPPPISPTTARSVMRGGRRRAPAIPEGRWSLPTWGQPDVASHAVFMCHLLLNRYGVAARELAIMDSTMPPWRVLYEVLSRLEMAGEVRRGYFVEGLSGVQFALPVAARQLAEGALPAPSAAPVVLLHSLDPANLYGSRAPFDIPLLDGGTRPLLRRMGNWLVLRAGRPVLIIEHHGKRLTALASASRDDVIAAVACLPGMLGRSGQSKLTVAEWNEQPVTGTPGRELLEAAGFVRDYQAMTLYATWR
jgi:ATP-dependent Lhr-like helicase